MLVRLYDRVPGEHVKIGEVQMEAIPREGETVLLDAETRIVHSVMWNLTDMTVSLLLR